MGLKPLNNQIQINNTKIKLAHNSMTIMDLEGKVEVALSVRVTPKINQILVTNNKITDFLLAREMPLAITETNNTITAIQIII